ACALAGGRDWPRCDDGDRCAAGESCMGGVCAGGVEARACSAGDPCAAALCHDGACGFSQPTVCPDDGDPCTEQVCSPDLGCSSRQIAGCCGADADCDDGDPCTEDACEGARCVNRADACWSITGRATATASALGRTVHLSRRFTGVLTIADDGSYRIPGGVCPQTGALYPDEV